MVKKNVPATKKGDSQADKIMSNMESNLVNKRYATAQMLDPSLSIDSGKATAKTKAKKRG